MSASVMVVTTDAFGGDGGIALYNRDLLSALCSSPRVARVVALPRLAPHARESMPAKLTFIEQGLDSKLRYGVQLARVAARERRADLIICGHINLLPASYVLRRVTGAPIVLFTYGIDAWQPIPRAFSYAVLPLASRVISISDFTLRRFLSWAPVHPHRCKVLPNAIHLDRYGPGPKSGELLERYGLRGKKVVMTLGRLAADERSKGIDEVLDLLPALVREVDCMYLVVGDGSDRRRLEDKARALGLADRVVFTGFIPESEKRAHYLLADAYVMPSRGEGFGFVFLEAAACGIPVVASTLDGGREALREGLLGILVDPGDPDQIKDGILRALAQPRGTVHPGLEYFAFHHFESRLHVMIADLLDEPAGLRPPAGDDLLLRAG